MKPGKVILIILIVTLVGAFFVFDVGQYFNLAYIKAKQADIDNFYLDNPLQTILLFFFIYVLFTGLSLPAAGILTIAGGAIFGVIVGTIIVSIASTIGATLAFLASRYLFRDFIQDRFADRLILINDGIRKDGALYLFTMRLVPAFPFFVINLVMGLTPMRTLTFALVSQVGMLAATVVFVNAGTQLARINSPGDILSPQLIGSFVLLGLFPLIAKKTVELIRQRRLQSGNSLNNDGNA